MKISSILSRYGLYIKFLILGLALTVWASVPAPAAASPTWCEEMGCVEWNAQNGCTATMFCCVFNDGSVTCWRNGVLLD